VGTSTLRVAVVVAAVVLGAVGLAKAIPGDPTRHIVPGAAGTASEGTSTSPSPPKTLPPSTSKSLTKGVSVQILNGSGKIGLAGDTRNTLKSAHLGYRLLAPGDYPRHIATTVIYYKPGYLPAAQHLAQKYFVTATYKQSTQYKAKLTVVLGADFASTTSP